MESHAPVWLNSRDEIIKWAVNLLEDGDALVVDTETTGLFSNDEIIQLAILDLDGKVLLDTLKYTYFRGKHDGERNYKSPSLISACTQQGILVRKAHEAVKDCLLTLELIMP